MRVEHTAPAPTAADANTQAAAAAADEEDDESSSSSSFDDGSSDEQVDSDDAGSSGQQASDDLTLQHAPSWVPDHTFKVLLVGDSGVGKTSLVLRFISDRFDDHIPSTVGVDFAIKRLHLHGRQIKVTIWDTAGQERFRALTSTFYRGAKGVIFVYDVTRRETLASLTSSWMAEVDSFQPHPEVAKMVVANKVDQGEAREVTWQEGSQFAQQHNCLFVETSAKQNIAVGVAFEELVLRIMETPALLQSQEEEAAAAAAAAAAVAGRPLNLGRPRERGQYAVSCSC